ncbi:hypothetical protein DM02DRAFT_196452 [Periconia macrospinosa]|uniref:DUF7730 domain-containing protein n=1 Tax=Periconia macrospinosa TaxID=97972 RepID=A0A2V1D9T7_9PLEO|nr:hypothetical protein DM02DRAFT_196452 [Periconia macrospinosa]
MTDRPSSPSRLHASSASQDAHTENSSYAYLDENRPRDFGYEFAKSHTNRASLQELSSISNPGICYILSLPRELRLMIWRYVLTDPSVPDLTAQITRQPLSPSKSSLRFPHPHIHVTLKPSRNAPININLLCVNHLIYQESLPILFHSVRFAPLDLEGIFPLFLDTLPPYNRSLIRHAKLRIPASIYDIDLFGDPSTCLFHWAVTCAQVAKVENLRDVMIEGFENHESTRVARGLLNPLAKLKARKIFCGENSDRAYQGLAEAEARLASLQTMMRKRLQRAEETQTHHETENSSPNRKNNIDDSKPQNPHATNSSTPTLRIATSSSSSTNPPIYDDDPPAYGADWDIVSMGSNATTAPSPSSSTVPEDLEPASPVSFSLSEDYDDSWTADTASVSSSLLLSATSSSSSEAVVPAVTSAAASCTAEERRLQRCSSGGGKTERNCRSSPSSSSSFWGLRRRLSRRLEG